MMKKMLALLLLCLSAVHAKADTVAWQENNGGGRIVLTDRSCESDPRQYLAYTSSNAISTQFGCWFSDDIMVHITWTVSGNFKSYPLEDWHINNDVAKRLRNKTSKGGKTL